MKSASPSEQQKDQTQVLKKRVSDTAVANQEKTESRKIDKPFNGQQLIDRSMEIARLASELSEQEQRYAKRPRISYLNAINAKSVVEASYLNAWVRKVERVGNLNYPDEASRKKLSGRLILHVTINQMGEVLRIELGESSGEQVLDDAARRIVKLAAPYSIFPAELRKDYDQLVITRTWVFQSEGGLLTEQ